MSQLKNRPLIIKWTDVEEPEEEYGFLLIQANDVSVSDVQEKIYEFKALNERQYYDWMVTDLVNEAFPKEWNVSLLPICSVQC